MSKSINLFIVEDEIVIAEDIKQALLEVGYGVIGVARDYDSAIKVLDFETPDLVLLDISLKGKKSGIDVALFMSEKADVPFIFITSHSNKSIIDRAKQTNPMGYLVKPFNQDDLFAAIEVALHNFNQQKQIAQVDKPDTSQKMPFKDSIFVKSRGVFHRVRFQDIRYIEADGVYTNIYTNERKLTERRILLEFEKLLDPTIFLRIHRSYIINANCLQGIKQDQVLIGDETIPLGRTYREKLLQVIG